MSKQYTVKELREELSKFNEDDIVIIKGTRNGTFSHYIDSIEYGKHKATQGKVCIHGRSY
ncbi:MAG: hypothetical protein GOVbin2917_112 [Prokaryotic dsDNA virus sp.]|jgi:hypothetical protein|nr:MAG: hypothetical protein GOVbin2917_112 [Prokaryotic dsDNA virus sp.]|tara:strand:- start:32426 stop:32605 length:180 start_codon:yes stop_codon:yes gene_type:complete